MEGQVPSLQRGEVYDLYCTDPETRDIAGVKIRYVHIDYFPDYWDIRTAGGGRCWLRETPLAPFYKVIRFKDRKRSRK